MYSTTKFRQLLSLHLAVFVAALVNFTLATNVVGQSSESHSDAPKPESLIQFVFDTTIEEGVKPALAIFDKHKDSAKFYFKPKEAIRTFHILQQRGMSEEANAIFEAVCQHEPSLMKSMAQKLFSILIEQGADAGSKWRDEKRQSNEFYLNEDEFHQAFNTFYEAEKFQEAGILAGILATEFPDSHRALVRLAEIQLAEGNKQLALQTYRDALNTESKNNFFKLAIDSPTTYVPTELPADASMLFKATGNLESNIAFVFVQGGPDPDFGVYREDPLTLLPNQEGIMRVNVKESQMLNKDLLASAPMLTTEQALFEHRKSAEMLHRTVEHLKSLDKKVYVIGHSYGCLICVEYLHSQPNTADKLIMLGSSFDQDLRNYPDSIKGKGKLVRWIDGLEPYEKSFFGDFPLLPLIEENLNRVFANTDMLVSAHSKQRFTKILIGKDLSNVIFGYGKFDESSGRTKQHELDFLESHGATVFESYGDHHSMLSPAILANVYNHLMNGEALKKSAASELSNAIETLPAAKVIENYKTNRDSNLLHPIVESEVNFLGYQLIKHKKLADAIEVFKFNADSFPNSWNTFDSLGEAYLSAGNLEFAEKYYQRSLEIHPGNSYGIGALKRIADLKNAKPQGDESPSSANEEAYLSIDKIGSEIEKTIKTVMADEHLPGAAIVLVRKGKTVFKRGFGFANIERKTRVDPDKTLFRIGSISKALTLLTLTRLVDDGRLKLDDDVSNYFDGIRNVGNFSKPVTIRHLMTHTTGFDQIGLDRHIRQFELGLSERKRMRPTIVDFLSANNVRRVSPAGQYFRYDTYGTTLAGAVIERVTGKPFDKAMRKEMFEPLGMTRSFVEAEPKHRDNLAIGYGYVGEQFVAQPYEVYVTTPASSIDATVTDMGKLLEAITGDGSNSHGRLFGSETSKAVLLPQFRPHPDFHGVTHGLRESSRNSGNKHVKTVGHGGSMLGFDAQLTIILDHDLAFFVITNRNREGGGGNVSLSRQVTETLIDNLPNVPERTPIPIPIVDKTRDLSEFTGQYSYGVFCHSCTSAERARGAWRRGSPRNVTQKNGVLTIGDEDFLPEGEGVFVQSNGLRKVFFGRDESGNVSFFVYSSSADTFEKF